MSTVTVLGAGSWGLTLAWLLDQSGHKVRLWDRKPEKIATIKANRSVSFPVQVTLNDSIELTDDLEHALYQTNMIIFAVTTAGTRPMTEAIINLGPIDRNVIMINASKGIDQETLKVPSTLLNIAFPHNPIATLSGPTLAPEILKGLPTAAVVAAHKADTAEEVQKALSTERFRLYTNTDMMGTDLGGALKNIFAIVSGYMQAKHLGDNAQSTLITRGLAEMTRFSLAMGADIQTLYGLSGLGDLLATCNSPLSRNYQVGYRLAQGQTLDDILINLHMVAEGVKTTEAVCQLSNQLNLDMPVVNLVRKAFQGEFSEQDMIHTLMSRRLKSELVR